MALTGSQITALASELNADPSSLGYADLLSRKDRVALLAVLAWVRDGSTPCPANNMTGAAVTLTLSVIPKNAFLTLTTAAAVRLALGVQANGSTPLSATLVTTWQTVLTQARAADPGSNIDIGLIATLGNPVTQGVISQAEYNAIYTRFGSRAEQLFGSGVAVSQSDLQAAVGW